MSKVNELWAKSRHIVKKFGENGQNVYTKSYPGHLPCWMECKYVPGRMGDFSCNLYRVSQTTVRTVAARIGSICAQCTPCGIVAATRNGGASLRFRRTRGSAGVGLTRVPPSVSAINGTVSMRENAFCAPTQTRCNFST